MSFAGFKSKNHPQQVKINGPDDFTDDRGTPDELFLPLHRRHGFTLDAAASASNTKCAKYYTRETDGIKQPWGGEVVWCNPPFSAIPSFIEKAITEVIFRGCKKVVMLLPANRCEQYWWQSLVEPNRDRPGSFISTEFVPGRPRFKWPEGHPGPRTGDRPPFGCVIITIESPGAGLRVFSCNRDDSQGRLFSEAQ